MNGCADCLAESGTVGYTYEDKNFGKPPAITDCGAISAFSEAGVTGTDSGLLPKFPQPTLTPGRCY